MFLNRSCARAFVALWLVCALAAPFPAHAQELPLNPAEERAVLQALERLPAIEAESTKRLEVIAAKDEAITAKNEALAAKDLVIAAKDEIIRVQKETIVAQVELVGVKQAIADHYKDMYAIQKVQADDLKKDVDRARTVGHIEAGVAAVLSAVLMYFGVRR